MHFFADQRFAAHTLIPTVIGGVAMAVTLTPFSVNAEQPLMVVYPPARHDTVAHQIFLIGTAPAEGEVTVNGAPIARNRSGHFAPSFPLKLGENTFTLRYRNQQLKIQVTRLSSEPEVPTSLTFGKDSLTPAVNIARLPDEWICFSAIAPPKASVSVKLANQTIPLLSQGQTVDLPANAAVLTQQNQPFSVASPSSYRGCTRTVLLGDLGQPEFQLTLDGKSLSQPGPGSIRVLAPTQLEVASVTADAGTARTGPSTDYSRLTPLPKGTQAAVTGYEGDWVRLDYGAWIRRSEVQIAASAVPPTSLIRSVKAKQTEGWTEITFPLQVPVPVSVHQGDRTFTLVLHNTTAQTDIIRIDDDPLIARLDWQQPTPTQLQYTFSLKSTQQWGYKLRYEGTSLILSLRHPPSPKLAVAGTRSSTNRSLSGIRVLLDPGHGGPEDLGARGPTGYPEKAVALKISQLVRQQLEQRGAVVYMTREQDVDVSLQDRVAMIQGQQPTIALSLHYNALPDSGDAENTQGVATFWFHPQAHSLAMVLHNHLVKTLKRPSYGVYWNNLALTRPAVAPAVLLELGFMINPTEFDWIVNAKEQQRLAIAIAEGVVEWVRTR